MTIEKRKLRLAALIKRLADGIDVAPKELQAAIGPEIWEVYQTWINNEQDDKASLSDPPDELKEYTYRLKKGDFLYSRSTSSSNASAHLLQKAESIYEHALIYLGEVLSKHPEYCRWLDRNFSLDSTEAPTLDPIAMPRLITSQSHHRQRGITYHLRSRRELKRDALTLALYELDRDQSDKQNHEENKSLIHREKPKKIDTSGWKI